MKRLLSGSIDGFGIDIFEQKCLNIKNTIVIVKSSKDQLFGGYTDLELKD